MKSSREKSALEVEGQESPPETAAPVESQNTTKFALMVGKKQLANTGHERSVAIATGMQSLTNNYKT